MGVKTNDNDGEPIRYTEKPETRRKPYSIARRLRNDDDKNAGFAAKMPKDSE